MGAIRIEAIKDIGESYGLGRSIISLSEKSEILKYYTTLNEDFTKRLKNLNKATDGKYIDDKRVKNSPPAKKFQKYWRIEDKIDTLFNGWTPSGLLLLGYLAWNECPWTSGFGIERTPLDFGLLNTEFWNNASVNWFSLG
ncbi:hypothetical protein RhiirA4_464204 [Rhizophagus irregularis]|uniref:Uncharacterized protein n=1 Tax=Rhizophagus irregularis TaxID=588596 RepID=A0A2I1GPI9_9GLOM|nr:hypothetical protein RhiirA4_464204 [Rhizophagus irregularis]